MLLCYQVATPDVAIAPSVTAFQGPLDASFESLRKIGYDGVELMTLNPHLLDWDRVKQTAARNDLTVALVCTGEIFGQLGLSFADPDADRRKQAISRVKDIIDFAAHLGAHINIGRVRGQYRDGVRPEDTYAWAVDAFRQISDHAAPKGVKIALETVTIMQTNFMNTLDEAERMLADVGRDNFRLMMDVFHLNLEEKNVLAAIRAHSAHNIHVHLADNNRRYPGHCGLDFSGIIQTFRDVGYDGAFCTEIFQIPDQQRAAEGAYAHLAPIFAHVYGR